MTGDVEVILHRGPCAGQRFFIPRDHLRLDLKVMGPPPPAEPFLPELATAFGAELPKTETYRLAVTSHGLVRVGELFVFLWREPSGAVAPLNFEA